MPQTTCPRCFQITWKTNLAVKNLKSEQIFNQWPPVKVHKFSQKLLISTWLQLLCLLKRCTLERETLHRSWECSENKASLARQSRINWSSFKQEHSMVLISIRTNLRIIQINSKLASTITISYGLSLFASKKCWLLMSSLRFSLKQKKRLECGKIVLVTMESQQRIERDIQSTSKRDWLKRERLDKWRRDKRERNSTSD